MKLSSQEEYGLRCLLHLARLPEGKSITISEISRSEGLSVPNVAKLMRLLRLGGMAHSERGQSGGYTLMRPAREIKVSQVLDLLGGQFFSSKFCERHAGREEVCTHAVDCSLRVLWSTVNGVLEEVLGKTTLHDLLCTEAQMQDVLAGRCVAPLSVIVRRDAIPV